MIEMMMTTWISESRRLLACGALVVSLVVSGVVAAAAPQAVSTKSEAAAKGDRKTAGETGAAAQKEHKKGSAKKGSAKKGSAKKGSAKKGSAKKGSAEKSDRPVKGKHAGQRDRSVKAGKSGKAGTKKSRENRRDSARRWKNLPPGTRRQLLDIYRKLLQLSPKQRQLLIRRLESLDRGDRAKALRAAKKKLARDWLERDSRQARREVWRRLAKKRREAIEKLPVPERRRRLKQLIARQRQKLIRSLPAKLRERVSKMDPRQQAQFLRRHQARSLLQKTFRRREVVALSKLRFPQIKKLLRPGGDKKPARPKFLSEESWGRWLKLERYQRVRLIRAIRRSTSGDRKARSGPAPRTAEKRPHRRAKKTPRPKVRQKEGR